MTTQRRIGQVLSGLVLLFMVFDGVIHVLRIAPVVDAFRQLGYPLTAALPLGIIELLCVALCLFQPTRLWGARLLTAYLGGAVATQLRIGAGPFELLFPVLLGVVLWAGLFMSDERMRAL